MKQSEQYTKDSIATAAQAIREGKLVAFPTETVFGLGAIANNDLAVQSVFKIKGRPNDNPLIVHVSSIEEATKFTKQLNKQAESLMKAFWPGPLTIIVPVEPGIFAQSVTAGLDTVGLRMPDNKLTLELIREVGFPLVGPSANLSGKPSPTTINHVLHDFNGEIEGVLRNDVPLTQIGVESTVVYPTIDSVQILRPGAITKSQLESVVDVPVIEKSVEQQLKQNEIMSPGVKYTHYSPKQPVYLVSYTHTLDDWGNIIKSQLQGYKLGILASDEVLNYLTRNNIMFESSFSLGKEGDIQSATRRLYAGLRELEETACDIIIAEGIEPSERGHAYMNRLSKAADYKI